MDVGMIHLRLPPDTIRLGPEQWTRLNVIGNLMPSGWRLQGLLPVDAGKPTHLSVRVMGQGPVPDEVRPRVADALGMPTLPAAASTLRVRGPGMV